jgi:hypothetical protein
LITSGAKWIVKMSRGRNAFSSAALTSSFFALVMKASSSGKVLRPGIMAQTPQEKRRI